MIRMCRPDQIVQGRDRAHRSACKVTHLAAEDLAVELQFDGKPIQPEHRQVIAHKGKDDVYTVRFQAKMDEVGTHTYQIKASSKTQKEIRSPRATGDAPYYGVADDKAKVLIVDGKARWEYHYLATTLARDPTIQLERVVFTQPRIGAVKDTELDKAGFAKTKLPEIKKEGKQLDPLMDYDCILLGDVRRNSYRSMIASVWRDSSASRRHADRLIAGKPHCRWITSSWPTIRW